MSLKLYFKSYLNNESMNRKVIFIAIGLLCLSTNPTNGQSILPDTSLPNNSQVFSDQNIHIITGGTRTGYNLFHSFSKFSVFKNQTAQFEHNNGISNIFTRITGISSSLINGIISSTSSANLFFINPNGIIFGSDATLRINGSFYATTATSVGFQDGRIFSSENLTHLLNLSGEEPSKLNFSNASGIINVNNSGHRLIGSPSGNIPLFNGNTSLGLQSAPEKTLALLAKEIVFEGGIASSFNGHIEVGAIKNGTVLFNSVFGSRSFDYSNVLAFGDISLRSESFIDNVGFGNSSINLQAKNIHVLNGSVIHSRNLGPFSDGEISLFATDNLNIRGVNSTGLIRSGILTEALSSGKGSSIIISANNLFVNDGGGINTASYLEGDAGDLNINIGNILLINGENSTLINDRSISADSVIGSVTFGQGNSGTIRLNAPQLFIQERGLISSSTISQGQGGSVYITANDLTITNGGNLGSINFGSGQGGNVNVNVENTINLIGTSPLLIPSVINSAAFSEGNAGNVNIITSELYVRDGARINTSTFSSGDAGNLSIEATKLINISGNVSQSINPSLIDSSANLLDQSIRFSLGLVTPLTGNSGSVFINTPQLSITDNAVVTVRNDGSGDAGNLDLYSNLIVLDNGSITASTKIGDGGNIQINSNSLILNSDSQISSSAGETGFGGNLIINSSQLLVNSSSLIAETEGGNGGNINILSRDFRFSQSQISATASESGDGGNVSIYGDRLIFFDKNTIIAQSSEGNGGSIILKANTALISGDNFISASSQVGFDGEIEFDFEIDRFQDFSPQTSIFTNQSIIADRCVKGSRLNQKNWVQVDVMGSGGLPGTESDPYLPDIPGRHFNNILPTSRPKLAKELVYDRGQWKLLGDNSYARVLPNNCGNSI